MSVSFFVEGLPQPQGSKKGIVVKGRAVVIDDNKKPLQLWRKGVAAAAAAAAAESGVRFAKARPLRVEVWFGMPEPEKVPAEREGHPTVRPDVDKLARALLDGITSSGLYEDDGQVVDLLVRKRYSDRPGAYVKVAAVAGEG